jgi:hypothetical protein
VDTKEAKRRISAPAGYRTVQFNNSNNIEDNKRIRPTHYQGRIGYTTLRKMVITSCHRINTILKAGPPTVRTNIQTPERISVKEKPSLKTNIPYFICVQ